VLPPGSPSYNAVRRAPDLCGILPLSLRPLSNDEKHSRQIQNEGQPAKYLSNILQKCQGHENKERQRTCGSDSRDHTDLMIKCNVALCSRKGTLGEVVKI